MHAAELPFGARRMDVFFFSVSMHTNDTLAVQYDLLTDDIRTLTVYLPNQVARQLVFTNWRATTKCAPKC